MKVLLTVAIGNLGRTLILLLKQKHILKALCRGDGTGKPGGIKWVTGDIVSGEGCYEALRGTDCVVHMAAVTHSNNPIEHFEVNAEGMRNLMEACEKNAVEHFIFISTRAIEPAGGTYSRSKLEAEKAMAGSYLNWTILRPSEVYGENTDDFITKLIRFIKSYALVPMPGGGTGKVAPLFINDFIRFVSDIIYDRRAYSKTYTLPGPREYTLVEFIDSIASFMGKGKPKKIKKPSEFFRSMLRVNALLGITGMLYRDQLDRLMVDKEKDFSLAKEDFGFDPIGLEEGLKEISLSKKI